MAPSAQLAAPLAKLARDLICPPGCYLVIVCHGEVSVIIMSESAMKPLRGIFMPMRSRGGADLDEIYNDAQLRDTTMSRDFFPIMKAFTIEHLAMDQPAKQQDAALLSLGFRKMWDMFAEMPIPEHLEWMEECRDRQTCGHYRLFGDGPTFAVKIT